MKINNVSTLRREKLKSNISLTMLVLSIIAFCVSFISMFSIATLPELILYLSAVLASIVVFIFSAVSWDKVDFLNSKLIDTEITVLDMQNDYKESFQLLEELKKYEALTPDEQLTAHKPYVAQQDRDIVKEFTHLVVKVAENHDRKFLAYILGNHRFDYKTIVTSKKDNKVTLFKIIFLTGDNSVYTAFLNRFTTDEINSFVVPELGSEYEPTGNKLLHYASKLHPSMLFDVLMARKNLDLTVQNLGAENFLHILARGANLGFLRYLEIIQKKTTVSQRKFLVNAKNILGDSPLTIALVHGNSRLANQFLRWGADPNLYVGNSQSTSNRTLLRLMIDARYCFSEVFSECHCLLAIKLVEKLDSERLNNDTVPTEQSFSRIMPNSCLLASALINGMYTIADALINKPGFKLGDKPLLFLAVKLLYRAKYHEDRLELTSVIKKLIDRGINPNLVIGGKTFMHYLIKVIALNTPQYGKDFYGDVQVATECKVLLDDLIALKIVDLDDKTDCNYSVRDYMYKNNITARCKHTEMENKASASLTKVGKV